MTKGREKKKDCLCEECKKYSNGAIGNVHLCRICAGKKLLKEARSQRKSIVNG